MADDPWAAFSPQAAPKAAADPWAAFSPQAAPDKPNFSWSQAITDIPHEIGQEAGSAIGAMGNLLPGRSSQGAAEHFLGTGRGVLGIPQLLASPFTGAARSLLGHGLANAEHAAGTLINPDVAAKDNPEAMYNTAKGDVDTAMSALAARGRAAGLAAPHPPPPETIGQFGVPLTEGEAQQNFDKIALERRALRGGEGNRAQDVARNFMDERNQRLGQVRDDIAQTMDPFGQRIVETPQDAAGLAGQGVRSAAQGLREIRNQRYDEMANLPGEFHASAFEGIAQRIRGELTLGDRPVIIDDRTTPIASQALQDIDNHINQLRIQNRADPFGQPSRENIIGINLAGVDQTRKRLVSFYTDARTWPPNADMRATQAVLRGFDDQVQQAIERGLFSGDDRALAALREARDAHSEYMRTYTSQGNSDDVGRVMQHILGSPQREAATPTEIANYLYGSAKVGAKGLSYRLADRLANVLGRSSPEWIGVKQGLWARLTDTAEGAADMGPQRIVNRITEFLNGDGQATAQRMFSPQERRLMSEYADVLRQTIPPPGAVNYSNNVPMLSSMRHMMTRFFMTTLGSHIGGLVGSVAGGAASLASKPVREITQARKIARSMPTLTESMRRWNQAMVQAQRAGAPGSRAVDLETANLAAHLSKLGMNFDRDQQP